MKLKQLKEAAKNQSLPPYTPEKGKFDKGHPVLVHVGGDEHPGGRLVHGTYLGPARDKSTHRVKMTNGEIEVHHGNEVASALGGPTFDNIRKDW